MDSKKLTMQMVSIQKAIFDNSFYGISILQDQTSNVADGFLRQFPWITENSKKPFHDSIAYMTKAREDYKQAVDQGFARLEELIDGK